MHWWAIPFVVLGIPLGLVIYLFQSLLHKRDQEGFDALGTFIGDCFWGGVITLHLLVILVIVLLGIIL